MRIKLLLILILSLAISLDIFPQSRINYNNQDLFLSGANLAWVSFANDIGPGNTDFNTFANVMLQMHDHGGNALRWWLHTNGSSTPEFNSSNLVVGPGEGTIEDLKRVLDLAWEREIGVILCLWSFDMLRERNPAPPPDRLERNVLLLTDTAYTRAYINNCLIPMVDSLKGHPGIIAWEIFNEPEGMSNEFGWGDIAWVPMSAIQRFINLCAGAIHRTDTSALVTSGAWSFLALTDVPTVSVAKTGRELSQFSSAEKEEIASQFRQKYRSSMTTEEIISYLARITDLTSYNYYSDSRLIGVGGDPDGTLDFYSVHYYSGIVPSNPTSISPFHHPKFYWQLDKPLVIAEFAMQNSSGILKEKLFDTLYQTGYAGALPWSWTDENLSASYDMLVLGMQYMWDNYREDVDVLGISGDWPVISILSPVNNSQFPDNSEVVIEAEASDRDGSIALVEFFASDTLKIGERDTLPYSLLWTNITPGNYILTAVATDDSGNKRTSNRVQIIVGTPAYTRIESDRTIRTGSGMSFITDPTASGGRYLEMRTNEGTVTWTIENVSLAEDYQIIFGYRLSFDRPKIQFINVNGQRVGEIRFDSTMNVWLEEPFTVNLVAGTNTIQMELSWGWMDLDYLAVPTNVVLYSDEPGEIPVNFSLKQNYPNPFNPNTVISYQLAVSSQVTLKVYDILGNEVATLVNETKPSGIYKIEFSAKGGASLASGVYFYRLSATSEAGNFIETKKMILLK